MKFIAKNTLKGATNEKCLSSTICRALSTRYPPSPFTIHGFIYTTRHIIPRKSEIHLLLGIIHGVPLPGNVFSLLFYFFFFFPSSYSFLTSRFFSFSFFFFLFPLRRNSNNLRSRRRAPSLTKSSEQPSLSRKIECRRTSTSIESHRFHVSYAPPFFLRQYHRRSHHDRLSKLNHHVQSREHSEHYYFKASIEFPTINNLRSTNQLTCCHANATRFEAGICISFVCSKFISSKST